MDERALIALTCIIVAVFSLPLWAETRGDNARQRAEAYCQEHLMVRVDTPEGEHCAPLWALERTTR